MKRQLAKEKGQLESAVVLSRQEAASKLLGVSDDLGSNHSCHSSILMGEEAVTLLSDAKNNNRKRRLYERALVSHWRGQAEGLANFVGREDAVEHVIATNVYDDASMWLKRPGDNSTTLRDAALERVDRVKHQRQTRSPASSEYLRDALCAQACAPTLLLMRHRNMRRQGRSLGLWR